jgi:MMPL family
MSIARRTRRPASASRFARTLRRLCWPVMIAWLIAIVFLFPLASGLSSVTSNANAANLPASARAAVGRLAGQVSGLAAPSPVQRSADGQAAMFLATITAPANSQASADTAALRRTLPTLLASSGTVTIAMICLLAAQSASLHGLARSVPSASSRPCWPRPPSCPRSCWSWGRWPSGPRAPRAGQAGREESRPWLASAPGSPATRPRSRSPPWCYSARPAPGSPPCASGLQWRYGLGYSGIESQVPVYIFVFLVALGVDYNIFLAARIREEARPLGTRQGTLRGLSLTGGVITAAGVVLAATFAALIVEPTVYPPRSDRRGHRRPARHPGRARGASPGLPAHHRRARLVAHPAERRVTPARDYRLLYLSHGTAVTPGGRNGQAAAPRIARKRQGNQDTQHQPW